MDAPVTSTTSSAALSPHTARNQRRPTSEVCAAMRVVTKNTTVAGVEAHRSEPRNGMSTQMSRTCSTSTKP